MRSLLIIAAFFTLACGWEIDRRVTTETVMATAVSYEIETFDAGSAVAGGIIGGMVFDSWGAGAAWGAASGMAGADGCMITYMVDNVGTTVLHRPTSDCHQFVRGQRSEIIRQTIVTYERNDPKEPWRETGRHVSYRSK